MPIWRLVWFCDQRGLGLAQSDFGGPPRVVDLAHMRAGNALAGARHGELGFPVSVATAEPSDRGYLVRRGSTLRSPA